jgi:PleD family two-component response regulator
MHVILLVNDYPPHVALVALQVILLRHQVVTAENSSDALEIASRLKPNLVIVDINLGEQEKLDALTLLRQHDGLQDTPILVISGSRDPSASERALSAGANEFLTKPFEPEQFRQALERCLVS